MGVVCVHLTVGVVSDGVSFRVGVVGVGVSVGVVGNAMCSVAAVSV